MASQLSAILYNSSNVVVRAEVAERKDARLGIKDQSELQPDAAFEQCVAKTANAEARVQMWCAEAVAHRGNYLANLFPLASRKATNRLL